MPPEPFKIPNQVVSHVSFGLSQDSNGNTYAATHVLRVFVQSWCIQLLPAQLTIALSNCLLPIISVLSNISLPGPVAMQLRTFPSHVLWTSSHGNPSRMTSFKKRLFRKEEYSSFFKLYKNNRLTDETCS